MVGSKANLPALTRIAASKAMANATWPRHARSSCSLATKFVAKRTLAPLKIGGSRKKTYAEGFREVVLSDPGISSIHRKAGEHLIKAFDGFFLVEDEAIVFDDAFAIDDDPPGSAARFVSAADPRKSRDFGVVAHRDF